MMIKSIASSSAGNCHYVEAGGVSFLIDIGIQWGRVQKALEFKASELDFALSTHRHADHSGYLKDAIRNGINCYAIQDVWDFTGIKSHRANVIEPLKTFRIKSLSIMAFPVPHDVENVGFLIADGEGNKLLYITDCFYSPYKFSGLTHIMLEVNYSLPILQANLAAGIVPMALKNRILKSHFSLDNVKAFLKANDLSLVREIHLIHLSSTNSDADLFKTEIERLTGKPTYIA